MKVSFVEWDYNDVVTADELEKAAMRVVETTTEKVSVAAEFFADASCFVLMFCSEPAGSEELAMLLEKYDLAICDEPVWVAKDWNELHVKMKEYVDRKVDEQAETEPGQGGDAEPGRGN